LAYSSDAEIYCIESRDVNKDQTPKDKDLTPKDKDKDLTPKDQDLTPKDLDKDLTPKDKEKDLTPSRTRTRIMARQIIIIMSQCAFGN